MPLKTTNKTVWLAKIIRCISEKTHSFEIECYKMLENEKYIWSIDQYNIKRSIMILM